MAVEEIQTTNYNIPKYISTDSPNLLDQYNAAMDVIDSELLSVNTAASNAATAAANAGTLANTANNTANAAKATADAAATQTYVDDLDTTLSNEIATVNANLIAQQVNGEYTARQTLQGDTTVYVANNYSYFFVINGFNLNANVTTNLNAIPGTNRYGIKIADAIMENAPAQFMRFPSTGTIYEAAQISGRFISGFFGLITLIIGTDNNMYIDLSDTNTYTSDVQLRFRFQQSKMTLKQLDIPESINIDND